MKLSTCKHCKKQFDISLHPKGWMANHSRWCEKNPKRTEYVLRSGSAIFAMKNAREQSGRTNQFSTAKLDGLSVPVSPNKGKPGAFLGKTHSHETKKLMSERARNSNHRRLRRGMVEYNGVMLDSSWEVRMAKKLDSEKILWTRPEPIQYVDKEGLTRNYFPDFYLPEYNVFLDPKNPQAFLVQKDKIDCLTKQYDNIIFLHSIDEIDNFAPVLALTSNQ
jgi:hypothetical protein